MKDAIVLDTSNKELLQTLETVGEALLGPPTVSHLWLLRAAALRVVQGKPICKDGTAFEGAARRWLLFLLDDAGTSRFRFIQAEVVPTETDLYDSPRVRPKKSDGALIKWIKDTSLLTATELEIALVVFGPPSQTEDKPRLAAWIRENPHILWRVHVFLLRRYCYPLLGVFKTALKQEGLWRPLHRGGEFTGLYPRVGGLVALGVVGVFNLAPLIAFDFTARWWLVLVVGLLLGCGLAAMILIDVFKQNRGVLDDWTHALPRIAGLLGCFAAWAVVAVGITTGVMALTQSLGLEHGPNPVRFLSGEPRSALLLPRFGSGSDLRLFLGWAVLAIQASFIGALLQWLWEDKGAIEPL